MVKQELEKLGLQHISIQLGLIEIKEDISESQKQELKLNLAMSGLELMDDKKSILIDKIKNVIVEMIHYSDEVPKLGNLILGCEICWIKKTLLHDYGFAIKPFEH